MPWFERGCRTRSSRARAVALAALAAPLALSAACSGDPGAKADAGDPPPDVELEADARQPCWPAETPAPTDGTTVELGTGLTAFEPIVDEQELTLVRGTQGLRHFDIMVRVTGPIDPGDPSEPNVQRNPANPRLMLTALTEDGTDADSVACPYRVLLHAEGDVHEMSESRQLVISAETGDALFGERVRIIVEILDADGRYARDERWVVAFDAAPPDAGPG